MQSVSDGATVRIVTVEGSDNLSGDVGTMIEELAALHGLGADLHVSAGSRSAGPITQSFAQAGGVTTVTRLS